MSKPNVLSLYNETPSASHTPRFTIYIASMQRTPTGPVLQWSVILASPTNRNCIMCDITPRPPYNEQLPTTSKYHPMKVNTRQTLEIPTRIARRIVHINKVCTAPVWMWRRVLDLAHQSLRGSQIWWVTFIKGIEEEGFASEEEGGTRLLYGRGMTRLYAELTRLEGGEEYIELRAAKAAKRAKKAEKAKRAEKMVKIKEIQEASDLEYVQNVQWFKEMERVEKEQKGQQMQEARKVQGAKDLTLANILLDAGGLEWAQNVQWAKEMQRVRKVQKAEEVQEAKEVQKSKEVHKAKQVQEAEDMKLAEKLHKAELRTASDLKLAKELQEAEFQKTSR
ncbi:hypothetical protein BJX64DRAFT_289596 [Aspergillus heterothallicus]